MTDELPLELCTWFAQNVEALRSRGVTGDIQKSPDDGRPKSAAWLTLEGENHVAVLIVWDSGEAEFECGNLATGDIRQEHRELRTPQGLLGAIEDVHRWVLATSGLG